MKFYNYPKKKSWEIERYDRQLDREYICTGGAPCSSRCAQKLSNPGNRTKHPLSRLTNRALLWRLQTAGEVKSSFYAHAAQVMQRAGTQEQ